MSLILNVPIEIATHLLSKWLKVPEVCKLEIAMCSPDNLSDLMTIYESTVMECKHCRWHKDVFEKQFDWMIFRKIRISSLFIYHTLQRSACTKLMSLLSSSKSLVKKLEIGRDFEVLDSLIMIVARYCKHLTYIEFGDCKLTQSFCELLKASEFIEELVVDNCTGLEQAVFDGVVCPSVRTLRVNGNCEGSIQTTLLRMCAQATFYERSNGKVVVLSGMPKTLQELYVVSCRSISLVQVNTGLRKLTLLNCYLTEETVVRIVSMCPRLTEIDLSANAAVTDTCTNLIGKKYGKILTSLGLRYCVSVSQSAVQDVCSKCTLLHSLDISENEHFAPSIFAEVLDRAPNLRRLLASDMTVPDDALRRIAASQLEFLDICDVDGCTDVGLAALMNGCVSLRSICISDNRISSLVKLLWRRQRPGLTFV